LEQLSETTENLRIASVLAKIQTGHLTNANVTTLANLLIGNFVLFIEDLSVSAILYIYFVSCCNVTPAEL
jgi:hypothetical protein